MARILIVDDQSVVRLGIRLILEKAGHEVVAEAGTGIEAIKYAFEYMPDLIILDIDLPKIDGFRVLERLCGVENRFKVLVFTGMESNGYSVRCCRAGASGFVSKMGEISDLLVAVQIALAGYLLFPTNELSSVDAFSRFGSEEEALTKLSTRELEVLRYLARGFRIKEVGAAIFLSEKTVSTYKARLIEKLQVKNLIELVELAKRNGLI